MRKVEDLEFLRQGLPFWTEIAPEDQEGLASQVSEKRFAAGETAHSGSADCSGLFLVKSGQLRVYLISDAGKEITMYRLFERDICIFSASCIMKNINFDVFVEAEEETEVLIIPADRYQELSERSAPVSNYTNQLMASRFSDVMWMIEQVLFMSFDRRLALFLLEQAGVNGSDTLHITQERIAQHMGSAREVVTRMLKYFQGEGLVELFRGGVKLTDRKRLEELAG